MIRLALYLLCGAIFGAGLALSGMVNPAKVTGFLDIGRAWDPSLAATMGGAVVTTFLLYRVARRRSRSLLGDDMPKPPTQRIDVALVVGAVVFGLGWGLAGICPAPAFAFAVLNPLSLWFVAGLAAGVTSFGLIGRLRPSKD